MICQVSKIGIKNLLIFGQKSTYSKEMIDVCKCTKYWVVQNWASIYKKKKVQTENGFKSPDRKRIQKSK